jgi:hypothetical protein
MASEANTSLSNEEHATSLNNFVIYFGDAMTTDDAIARPAPAQARRTA